jgi:hypothetical protein
MIRLRTNLKQFPDNTIKLRRRSYSEEIFLKKQSGGPGMIAICEIRLTPLETDVIEIMPDSEISNTHLEYIGKGIEQIIGELSIDQIGLFGFRLQTGKHKIHPVDSSPMAYLVAIKMFLRALISGNNLFERIISTPKLKSYRYEIIKGDKITPYQNLEFEEVVTPSIPKTFSKTISLASILQINQPEGSSLDDKIEYQLESLSRIYLGNNKIRLRVRKGVISMRSMGVFLNIVNKVVEEFKDKRINLVGFLIYIKPKESFPYERYELKELEFQRFEWALRNILNNEELLLIE